MSKRSRGRTTGPRYKAVKSYADLTEWLNRAVSRGGRGTSHTAQKRRKVNFYGPFGPSRRSNKRH